VIGGLTLLGGSYTLGLEEGRVQREKQ